MVTIKGERKVFSRQSLNARSRAPFYDRSDLEQETGNCVCRCANFLNVNRLETRSLFTIGARRLFWGNLRNGYK
jgi:hypothetical protein